MNIKNKNSIKVVGFIPAKGTSTRVKNKNFREILGLPMYLWAANNLKRVLPREDIYIDSENDEILDVCNKLGFGTIKRDGKLATNKTNGNELMEWEVSQVDGNIYIQHLPPMIFLKKTTLEKIINTITNGYDSATLVYKQKMYNWDSNGPLYDIKQIPNSFELPDTISETMGLYVTRKNQFNTTKVRVSGNISLIETDAIESIDINYEDDFILAQAVANGLPNDSEYIEGVGELLKEYKKIKNG